MFFSSSSSVLASLALSAVAVSATQSLSLKVAGPSDVTDVENLKVTTTITNTGDETLKLFNHPRSALSKLPANTFVIGNSAGASPKFTGVYAKYSMDHIVAKNSSAFTVLAPGESVDREHDLSAAYDFTDSGEDAYDFDTDKTFYHLADNGTIIPLEASTSKHSAKLAGKLAVARLPISKRADFNKCNDTQSAQINDAIEAATNYAAEAYEFLSDHNSTTKRYKTWFGKFNTTRYDKVSSHFQHIHEGDYTSFKYDCSCDEDGTFAYVYPEDYGVIYLCPAFWEAETTGTDSRGGTLIHEASHFEKNGGTDDIVYQKDGARDLAKNKPNQAVMNADNHEYFAENHPSLS
ncbi:hypothetical protein EV714DRAFT_250807 [Schizophyllum commune]